MVDLNMVLNHLVLQKSMEFLDSWINTDFSRMIMEYLYKLPQLFTDKCDETGDIL
jgi:hypothetical protein